MDLKDATLMLLTEAAGYPAVAEIAQTAYDRIVDGAEVDYRVLSDLVGEASGKGILREMNKRQQGDGDPLTSGSPRWR